MESERTRSRAAHKGRARKSTHKAAGTVHHEVHIHHHVHETAKKKRTVKRKKNGEF